jgi:hypothetical protein
LKDMRKTSDTLTISHDGKTKTVSRSVYAKAKLKQLREFGYTSLTLSEIENQISAILEGVEFGDGLTVIGMFMEDEIIKTP